MTQRARKLSVRCHHFHVFVRCPQGPKLNPLLLGVSAAGSIAEKHDGGDRERFPERRAKAEPLGRLPVPSGSLENLVKRYEGVPHRRWKRQAAVALPPLVMLVVWMFSWRWEILCPHGVLPRPLEMLGWLLLAILAASHRPWGGTSLGLGAFVLVPSIERLGTVPTVLVAAVALILADSLRQAAAVPPGKKLEASLQSLSWVHLSLPPLVAAVLLAGLGRTGMGPAEISPSTLSPIFLEVTVPGLVFVLALHLVALACQRWRSAVGMAREFPGALGASPWPPAYLALDGAAWVLGALVTEAARRAGWGWLVPLVLAIALLAAEAARNDILRGVSDHRAGDLERLQEAHVRILAETAGMGEIAQQILTECHNVLPVHHFQFERLWGDDSQAEPRSWSAGHRGTVSPGEPRPEARPRMLPGVHRRADWKVLEKFLVAEGETLAVVRLWCDPRSIKPGAEELLTTLVPQMASSVHRARLDREAKLDPLTGVPVRRILERRLQKAYRDCCEEGRSMAVIMCDIDFFKKVNDTHGHAAGDAALVAFARALEAARRETDLLCRYGGEEFTLLLENTAGAKALQLAERLRKAVEDIPLVYEGRSIPLTMSTGVAAFPELHIKTASELQLLADEALYQAKASGRNRCLLNIGRGAYLTVDGERLGNSSSDLRLPHVLG